MGWREYGRLWNSLGLTESDGVVDAEAAENVLNVPGMKEAVSSDHHLEGF